MPEVIMPRGASIAGFVMAIITWYGALRNAVQTMHDDIKASKSYKQDINGMVEDLRRQERQLENWRRFWHIRDGIPERTYAGLWGDAEATNILIRLGNITRNCQRAQEALRAYTDLSESKWKAVSGLKKKRTYGTLHLDEKKICASFIRRCS